MRSQSPAPPLMHRHHGLQGPRPSTLKVTKADQQLGLGLNKKRRPVQQQTRRPVIIFVESPKVVHAHPSEFKAVVQRLTGRAPPSSSLMTMFPPLPASADHLPPPLPLPLQFPFQLYGQSPLVASRSLSTTVTVAAPPVPADYAGGVTSLGFFSNDQLLQIISPAAFMYDQSMVAPAAAGAANPLVLPSSSIGPCYHGDLFVSQQ